MNPDKDPRADAKLKNLPESALEELWLMRNPGEDGEKMTMEAICVEVPLRYGFTVSRSTLSEFYSWLKLKRRMEAAAERAAQARLELAKDPNISPADIERVAQTVFTAETLQDGNVKGYVALAKLELQRKAVANDSRRIELLEKKAAQADAAKGVSENEQLTPEEKAARLKQIFGMG